MLVTMGWTLRNLIELVLPATCAGCEAWGWTLCPACQKEFTLVVARREAGAGRLVPANGVGALPVWGLAWYRGPARRAVLAWKRQGRTELTEAFCLVMRVAAQRIAPAVAMALDQCPASRRQPVAVVPMPSSARSTRRRDGATVAALAQAVAAGLEEGGLPAQPVDCLRRTRGSREQVGLGNRARSLNRVGTTQLRWPQAGAGRPAYALIVDDVLTTGASMLDAEQVLSRGGVGCCGALVIAATPAQVPVRAISYAGMK